MNYLAFALVFHSCTKLIRKPTLFYGCHIGVTIMNFGGIIATHCDTIYYILSDRFANRQSLECVSESDSVKFREPLR